MDIARPEFKRQKLRRQIVLGVIGVVVIAAATIGVSRLRPAAPSVERGTVWTDTVKHGSMLRQVRGPGSLVPTQEAVRQIPAETEATVVRIRMLPGSQVKAERHSSGNEQSPGGASGRGRTAAIEGRRSRVPESAGEARERSDDPESGRCHRALRTTVRRNGRRTRTRPSTTSA